jgi:hypothetical protein
VPKDLSHSEGLSWRVERIDAASRLVCLEAYDSGGFYDFLLNAEGLTYPPQVPGNYYADAYAALALAMLYSETGDREYLEASCNALDFILRVYPQYKPAAIVWHHSDFKNPAFIEAVEHILAPQQVLDGCKYEAYRGLIGALREDRYSPTNVYALRFHWHAAREHFCSTDEQHAIESCVRRLEEDQTADGLFHDNIDTYPDAHDLTYHQYALSCLAQGLRWRDHARARQMFVDGVRFSIGLTTPNGEIAYVGRGANNVYHVASAILAFETAISMGVLEGEVARQARRAAALLLTQLEAHLQSNGMLPTAMNALVNDRVAWNHCETPYNALVAVSLLKAAQLAADGDDQSPLPLERPGTIAVLNDSGYATVRTQDYYAVLFAGCAESYRWSEGRHVTGVAGLAQLGIPESGPLLPILDEAFDGSRRTAITDMPVINAIAAFGRGTLSRHPCALPAVLWTSRYGGCACARVYVFLPSSIVVGTRVSLKNSTKATVEGIVSIAVCDDQEGSVQWHNDRDVEVKGAVGSFSVSAEFMSAGCKTRRRISPAVTNPRGYARRLSMVSARLNANVRSVTTWHSISLQTNDSSTAPELRIEDTNPDTATFANGDAAYRVEIPENIGESTD